MSLLIWKVSLIYPMNKKFPMPTLRDKHPLKRKSIKPSSSTLKGMLTPKLSKALEAAMQSLRTVGLRLEWQWKNSDIGWACFCYFQDIVLCELRPTQTPLTGVLILTHEQLEACKGAKAFPKKFKPILEIPIDEDKAHAYFEFPLESTPERDLFTEFVESTAETVEPLLG